jgi:GT2 family glycosyltransferase
MSVDIIIPCYNGARYLRETLNSALAQTYKPIRILVVDDGSTDSSRRIVESYGSLVHYLYKENGGQASARNLGIADTESEYLCLLDADDLLAPEMIERLIEKLENSPQADFAHCLPLSFWDNDTAHLFAENWRPGIKWRSYVEPLSVICAIHGSATVFRRRVFECYGNFPETRALQGCEDWHFWLQAVLAGAVIACVPEVLCFYRQHRRSSSFSRIGIARRESELMKSAVRMFEESGIFTERNRAILAAGISSVASRWLVLGREDPFEELYQIACQIAPTDFRKCCLDPLVTGSPHERAVILHIRLSSGMLDLGFPHLAAIFFIRAGDGRELKKKADRQGIADVLIRVKDAMAQLVAEEINRTVEKKIPSYASYLATTLAMIDRAEKRNDEARFHLEQAIELDPNNIDALYHLMILNLKGFQIRKAILLGHKIGLRHPFMVPRRILTGIAWLTLSRLGLKPLVERQILRRQF